MITYFTTRFEGTLYWREHETCLAVNCVQTEDSCTEVGMGLERFTEIKVQLNTAAGHWAFQVASLYPMVKFFTLENKSEN